ncbi:TPA: hypothetical protein ACFNMH_002105, partial [Neisseria elongata]
GVRGGLRGRLGKIRSDLGRKQPKTCVWVPVVGGKEGEGYFAKVSFRLSNHPHRLRPFIHQNNLRVAMLTGKIKIDKAMSAAGIKGKRGHSAVLPAKWRFGLLQTAVYCRLSEKILNPTA